MDALKEIYDGMTSRLKSHVFGSIGIAFVLWNWKVIYVLCFSKLPILERIEYFDCNTSGWSLYFFPTVIGLAFGLFSPKVNEKAHEFVSKPLSAIKSRDEMFALDRVGRLEDKKLEVEEKKKAVEDKKVEVKKVIDEQQGAANELKGLKQEITSAEDRLSKVVGQVGTQQQKLEDMKAQMAQAEKKDKAISDAEGGPILSKVEEIILVTASMLDTDIYTHGKTSSLHIFKKDLLEIIPDLTSTRAKAEVDDALERFIALKLAQRDGYGGSTLTSKGYKLADKLKE
jgi:hypothetical protein